MPRRAEDPTAYFKLVGRRSGFRWPDKLPKGRVLVHNHVMHTTETRHGERGFHCWTQQMDKRLVRCRCGWRGVDHYRFGGAGGGKSFAQAEIDRAIRKDRMARERRMARRERAARGAKRR
jgi:hypothetical protein